MLESLFVCGGNKYQQLGAIDTFLNNDTDAFRETQVIANVQPITFEKPLFKVDHVIRFFAGHYATFFQLQDYSIYVVGNTVSEFDTNLRLRKVEISSSFRVIDIFSRHYQHYFLTDSGKVLACGSLRLPLTKDVKVIRTPELLDSASWNNEPVIQMGRDGDNKLYFLTILGNIYIIAAAQKAAQKLPIPILNSQEHIVQMEVNDNFKYLLTNKGHLFAVRSFERRDFFVELENVNYISMGGVHSFFRTDDGSWYFVGSNGQQQLSLFTNEPSTPKITKITNLLQPPISTAAAGSKTPLLVKDIKLLSAGFMHTVLITNSTASEAQQAITFGSNNFCQCGNASSLGHVNCTQPEFITLPKKVNHLRVVCFSNSTYFFSEKEVSCLNVYNAVQKQLFTDIELVINKQLIP